MRAISSAVSMSCRQAPGGRTTAHCGQGQCPAAASGPCSHQHLQHGDGWSAAGCRGCMCRVMYCPCSRCSAAAAGGRGGPGTGRGHECCSQHSCGPPACQHSAALAPVSGHSGWRPYSHSEAQNCSSKYFPFTTKILHLLRQIIANYINIFRPS